MYKTLATLALLVGFAGPGIAQEHTNHMAHMANQNAASDMAEADVSEPGQSAFAAIQEVVSVLASDPDTDWARTDIDGLRAHLVDMDNVTLRADVVAREIEDGAEFTVTSADPAVQASIRTMVAAHAATMNGTGGLEQLASEVPGGAVLRVTGGPEDAARIRGLGFFGTLTLGAHHQAHHLALARGEQPHAHQMQ